MEKVKLTPEQKKISAKMRGLKMRVFNNCKPEEGKPGINAMKHQLYFLETHPNTILPVPELSHLQTVECFRQGINKYLGVDTHND